MTCLPKLFLLQNLKVKRERRPRTRVKRRRGSNLRGLSSFEKEVGAVVGVIISIGDFLVEVEERTASTEDLEGDLVVVAMVPTIMAATINNVKVHYHHTTSRPHYRSKVFPRRILWEV